MNTELYNWLKLAGYETQQALDFACLDEDLCLKEGKLSKERALSLAHKVRPIMSKSDTGEFEFCYGQLPRGEKFWVDTGGIYFRSYPFENMPITRAEGLQLIGEITTYHHGGIDNSLKPSVFEVLYQIPEEFMEQTVAFELYSEQEKAQDAYIPGLKRHQLKCLLYKGNMLKKVEELYTKW